jgi:CcmD family protein
VSAAQNPPTDPTNGAPGTASSPRANGTALAAVAPAPIAGVPTAEDRSAAFRAVQGGSEMQSGEALLVEAYAAVWIILFAMIFFSWRRQRALDERVRTLEGALARARVAAATSSASEGAGEVGGG